MVKYFCISFTVESKSEYCTLPKTLCYSLIITDKSSSLWQLISLFAVTFFDAQLLTGFIKCVFTKLWLWPIQKSLHSPLMINAFYEWLCGNCWFSSAICWVL